jgi:hypothetical protein
MQYFLNKLNWMNTKFELFENEFLNLTNPVALNGSISRNDKIKSVLNAVTRFL